MINCCNCSTAGRAQRLEWVRRQLDTPATFSSILSQNVQLSITDEAFARRVSLDSEALRARPEREVCNPQIHLLHLPQHLSHFEARKTDNDNAKQQKRKIEDNSNCLQPLACAQASHPVFKQAGGKAGSPLTRMEPSLSSIKKAPFFHCTIAGWPRPIHFLWQKSPDLP